MNKKEQLFSEFLWAFELVFSADWEHTKGSLCDEWIDMFIHADGDFINPNVDDEYNNWSNRGSLLHAYRELNKEIAESEHDTKSAVRKIVFEDIVELKELDSYKKVNAYLKAGWILINTYISDFGHPVEKHQKMVYCLGWSQSLGKSIHPEDENTSELNEALKRFE